MSKLGYKIDISGKRYGRLVVQSHSHTVNRLAFWNCICDCGKTKVIRASSLTAMHTISCGCMKSERTASRNRTHGMTHLPEYKSWMALRERCQNPNHVHYDRYMARGIKVCDGWNKDFESFFTDLGSKPTKRHSIDRIDNDKNYSCGHCEECISQGWIMNCRWSSDIEQANNRHNSIKIEHDGKIVTLAELSRITGVKYSTLHQRHRLGQPLLG